MKSLIKKYIPEKLLIWYHYAIAYSAGFWYGYPGSKMIMIGITGTKGKTSTANFIWSVLSAGGYKTGLLGTANIRIGQGERINPYHMTMPKPFVLQKILRDMYRAGCTHVVMEATSEGMKLGRHIGIDFDVAIFNNLSPEHLPNHGGSFEKYKEAKSTLFRSLSLSKEKVLSGKKIEKLSIINTDDAHGTYFALLFPKVITYGFRGGDVRASNIISTANETRFVIDGIEYQIQIAGEFNVYNAIPAIIVGKKFGLSVEQIQLGVASLATIPGRMEIIHYTGPTVIVDYAHEKLSMNALLDATKLFKKDIDSRTIILFGAQGGGRDKEKRKWMGLATGEKADIVILTSDDSYDEAPTEIIQSIAPYVREMGKKDDINLFLIPDRRLAIRKAFEIAKNNDIVVLAGKGSEQFMITNEGNVPWDDRTVAKEELLRIKSNSHLT